MESPLYRREYLPLQTFGTNSHPGFTHRSINRLALDKPMPDALTIETNCLKRDMKKNTNNIVPLLEYQLWLEAGKLDKINFKTEQADPEVVYNSNLWRNFRSSSGLIDMNKKRNVSESVSTLYPINIPSPSQVGTNTLSNFYDQNRYNMFKSDKTYNLSVARVEHEATFMKFLRLKSELRNPPLDYDGSIMPPKNFQSYPPLPKNPYHKEKSNLSDNDYIYRRAKIQQPMPGRHGNELAVNSQIDFSSLETAINRRFTARTRLTARDNHPDYDKLPYGKKHGSSAKTPKTNLSFNL